MALFQSSDKRDDNSSLYNRKLQCTAYTDLHNTKFVVHVFPVSTHLLLLLFILFLYVCIVMNIVISVMPYKWTGSRKSQQCSCNKKVTYVRHKNSFLHQFHSHLQTFFFCRCFRTKYILDFRKRNLADFVLLWLFMLQQHIPFPINGHATNSFVSPKIIEPQISRCTYAESSHCHGITCFCIF